LQGIAKNQAFAENPGISGNAEAFEDFFFSFIKKYLILGNCTY